MQPCASGGAAVHYHHQFVMGEAQEFFLQPCNSRAFCREAELCILVVRALTLTRLGVTVCSARVAWLGEGFVFSFVEKLKMCYPGLLLLATAMGVQVVNRYSGWLALLFCKPFFIRQQTQAAMGGM
jgi:hypothetical protein